MSALSSSRLPLSPHVSWLNVRHNFHQFSLAAILFASAIQSAPHPFLVREHLFEPKDAELSAALGGAVILLGRGVQKNLLSVLSHPLVKHCPCQNRVL
jgi:hypothetical protein